MSINIVFNEIWTISLFSWLVSLEFFPTVMIWIEKVIVGGMGLCERDGQGPTSVSKI